MVVCKFYQQGNCRFGDKCRNEHPGAGTFSGSGSFGGNRFGALANSGGSSNGKNSAVFTAPTADDVRSDLTEGKGRPNWILSAYGPGKNPPLSLLEANEFSPEEVRVRFYEAASNGKQDEADREAVDLWNRAQQSMNNVKNGAENVRRTMEDATRTEPNRYSLCKMDGTKPREQLVGNQNSAPSFGNTQAASNPFSNPPKSTFGVPSAFGSTTQTQSPFSRPALGSSGFGSNVTQQAPVFGQGTFGAGNTSSAIPQSAPVFGQGAFGGSASAAGALGATSSSNSQQAPTFGKSTFGAASSTTSTFGGPSFGQSSTLGKPSFSSTGFSQPTFGSTGFGTQSQTNPFAAPSASSTAVPQSSPFGQQPTFGQTGFSGSSNQQSSANTAFGQPSQPSAFGSGATGTGIFGKPTQIGATGTGGFGTQQNQPMLNTSFGKDNPFSAKAPANPSSQAVTVGSPLSKEADMGNAPSRPASSDNPFSKPPAPPTPTDVTVSSPQPAAATLVRSSSRLPGATARFATETLTKKVPITYTQTLPNIPSTYDPITNQLATYRGQKVIWADEPITYISGEPQPPKRYPCYQRPDGKGLEKIWFPEGNDDPQVKGLEKARKDFESPEEEYTEEVVEAYKQLHLTGKFPGGVMPKAAPMRDFIDCDF